MILVDRAAPAHYKDVETGLRFHSVSQCLDVLYPNRFSFVQPDVLAAAQDRGVRRHLLFGVLALWKAGLAEEPQINARDEAVAIGLVKWIHEHDIHPLRVEESALNRKDGYGGTPDCQVLYGPKRTIVLVDLKSGGEEDAHGLQLDPPRPLQRYQRPRTGPGGQGHDQRAVGQPTGIDDALLPGRRVRR